MSHTASHNLSRIGDLLLSSNVLSRHDVEEVLEEQRHAGNASKPFGQTALSLGLCAPNHVWQAWADQLHAHHQSPPTVDLNIVGIDAQAVASFPLEMAIEYGVLPLRLVGGILILAVAPSNLDRARTELANKLSVTPRYVLADPADITRGVEICFLPYQACA